MSRSFTRQGFKLSALALGLLLFALLGRPLRAQEAVVRFYLFYGETCPHCHDVMEDYLPAVYEKYGGQVESEYIEIYNSVDNYLMMLGLQQKLGVPEDRRGLVPALVIGDRFLVGGAEIPAKLEAYIDEYLAQGGVDWPSLEDLPEVVLPAAQPTVQMVVFFSRDAPDFSRLNELIISLGQEYGNQLQVAGADLAESQTLDLLAELNAAFGVDPPASESLEILVGGRLLVGIAQIERELPALVEQYLAQGGASIPPWDELVSGTLPETPGPPSPVTEEIPQPIYLAYFEAAGCQDCARTTYDLRVVQDRYPQLQVESFSMEEEENKVLNEWLSEKYGVPEQKRLSTPMVFVGGEVLIGREATLNNLLAAVGKYAQTGAGRTWEDFDPASAEQGLIDRFWSFGVLTVLGAGLIDGLNPCAFATLVFFISYMAFTGRRGRDILLVGAAFALGVFGTYLAVGVGLLKAVQSLGFFSSLGRWVYLVTALLCVILAMLTFRDWFKARQGQPGEMALKLPTRLRRQIHKVIREGAQVRAFVAMAFVTGFVVSLIELACTGQVYLPTIVYVMSHPELASRAFLYLVLYCLMFVLPLIIVFVLSYLGTTSEELSRFVNRHTATVKFLTGLVFVALALWMSLTFAPLFGVAAPWNWVLLAGIVILILAGAFVLKRIEPKRPQKPVAHRRRSRA
jgi:cytochrome c biogenesis protein CcdA/thiol-disulfide isomerase/thioredoxin